MFHSFTVSEWYELSLCGIQHPGSFARAGVHKGSDESRKVLLSTVLVANCTPACAKLLVMRRQFPFSTFLFHDNLSLGFAGGRKFSSVTTDFPVFASNSLRAFFATLPPFLLAFAFSVKPFACSLSAI